MQHSFFREDDLLTCKKSTKNTHKKTTKQQHTMPNNCQHSTCTDEAVQLISKTFLTVY